MSSFDGETWPDQFARFGRLRELLLSQVQRSRGLRIAASQVTGAEGLIIWGRSNELTSLKNAFLVWKNISKWCEFDGYTWQDQKPVFSELLCKFFHDNGPYPGWITILSGRTIYRHRLDVNIHLEQTPSTPSLHDSFDNLHNHGFSFGGIQFPKRLAMATKHDRPIKDAQILNQTIKRKLIIKPINKLFVVRETFVCLTTSGSDSAEHAGVILGRIPTVEEFYDEEKRILTSPIVSLVKMNGAGNFVEILCFDLNPFEGTFLDFRFLQPKFDYYLYSGANSYDLLTQVVSRGCWFGI